MRRLIVELGVLLLLCAQSNAFAATLVDPTTGLTVTAPKGYKLSNNNGVYTVKGPHSSVRFIRGRSALNIAKTVDSFVKLAKIKRASKAKKGSAYKVTGTLSNKPILAQFKPSGEFIDVAIFKAGSAKKKNAALRELRADVTIADVLALQRIVASRRGGITLPLPVTIPMKQFVAPDGGSSALVPDLPGWSYSGGGGVISGANANQGIVNLGIPVAVSIPGFFGDPPSSNFVNSAQAIASVWPQYALRFYGAQVQVVGISEVPGTRGWFGIGTDSALYAVSFKLNGASWQALMSSWSTTIPGLSIGWYWYHSYIAVRVDGPGGIGAALINTWSSWDNSGASQARLNDALNTLLSIRVTGYPIDPEVFQKAADDWDEYIRG